MLCKKCGIEKLRGNRYQIYPVGTCAKCGNIAKTNGYVLATYMKERGGHLFRLDSPTVCTFCEIVLSEVIMCTDQIDLSVYEEFFAQCEAV